MNNFNKIKNIFFCFILSFILFGCQEKYKELVNHKGSDYRILLQVCDNSNHLDRLSSYANDKIVLENILLEDCLSELLDKDKSLITFEDTTKKNIMVNVVYENFRKNSNVKETKRTLLIELKKILKFSLTEEFPKDKYQLVIKKSTLLKKHLSKNSKYTSSVNSGPGVFNAYNSSMSSIANGLNNVYKDKAFFLADSTDGSHYSFKIENIPFDKLKIYIENNIGLSFVTMDKIEGAKTTTIVVLND
jgi:hypothetical protein